MGWKGAMTRSLDEFLLSYLLAPAAAEVPCHTIEPASTNATLALHSCIICIFAYGYLSGRSTRRRSAVGGLKGINDVRSRSVSPHVSCVIHVPLRFQVIDRPLRHV